MATTIYALCEPGTPERRAARSARQQGRKDICASSSFLGISVTKSGKWRACISYEREKRSLGTFEKEVDAARAYDAAVLKFYGPGAKLNFPISPCGS